MNIVAIENAIGARLTASLATAGADVQGVWSEIAEPGIEVKQGGLPIVLFTLLLGTDDDTFDKNGGRIVYRVWVTDHRLNTAAPSRAAYAAVYGNGTPTSAPTVGLHRWEGSPTGMNITQCRRTNYGHPHEGNVLRYFMDFEIYAQEA